MTLTSFPAINYRDNCWWKESTPKLGAYDVKAKLEKADLMMHGGTDKREEIRNDEHLSKIEFRTNKRPSNIKVPETYKGINWDKQIEKRKSSTHCKVEHPFLIVNKQFGYAKVVYRGIAKNMNRFHILFASANLVMCARAERSRDFCIA